MTNYLIRRVFQMVVVILLAALFVYFLFNISPGGPLAGHPAAAAAHDARGPGPAARPVRAGPVLAGALLALAGRCPAAARSPSAAASCLPRTPGRLLPAAYEATAAAAAEGGRLRRLRLSRRAARAAPGRSSRADGILRGDFGLSTVILRDRPVSESDQEPDRGDAAADDHFAAAFAADRRADRHLQRGQAVLAIRLLLHDRLPSSARPCRPSSLRCC